MKESIKVYSVEFRCGLDYEGDSFRVLGIFDSKEKAENAKTECENSQDYQKELDMWDYCEIDVVEYELNSLESIS